MEARLELYDIFRNDLHLSDDKARHLVSTLGDSCSATTKEELRILAADFLTKEDSKKIATKDDIHDVLLLMSKMETGFTDRIGKLETNIAKDLSSIKANLHLNVITCVLTILGGLYLIHKYLGNTVS